MKTIKEVIQENRIKMDFIRLEKNKDNLWTIKPQLEDDNDRGKYNKQAHRLSFHLTREGLCRGFSKEMDVIGCFHFTERARR